MIAGIAVIARDRKKPTTEVRDMENTKSETQISKTLSYATSVSPDSH
jgi:hypothetical protein